MPKPPNFYMYFGGKYKHAQKLIERFPEHQCYVDVFGGAGNVLIQKKPSHIEIFNDIDSDIVNLFRQVRDNSELLSERSPWYHIAEKKPTASENASKRKQTPSREPLCSGQP